MSLFKSLVGGVVSIGKSIFSAAKQAIPAAVGYAVGGPIGGAIGGMVGGGGAPPVISANRALVPTQPKTVLPGAGTLAGLGAAGFTGAALHAMTTTKSVGTLMSDGTIRRRRRRRRGITATELKNHARVEGFLQKNFKCKSGGTRGTYLRRKSR